MDEPVGAQHLVESDSSSTSASDVSLLSRHLHSLQIQVRSVTRSLQELSDLLQVLRERVRSLESLQQETRLQVAIARVELDQVFFSA